MAEKSLFFNALADPTSPTGYDRNYNADDISDWMSVIWTNGVVKDGLKIEASSGMTINVQTGRASIKGKAYINNSIRTFTIPTAPTGTKARYDMIVLRYDNNVGVRNIELVLRTGQEFNTTPTDAQFLAQMTRNSEAYELLIGYVRVDPNITSIAQGNIGDRRANTTLCGWFTAVKGYEDYYDAIVQTYESVVTMASTGRIAISNLPSNLYNSRYSLINVYTNGIREPSTNYTIQTSGAYIQVTFTSNKSAGTKITIDLGNFIDGEGLSTAIASYNQWVADVETLKEENEYTYVCNGTNDNILIGNLVKTYLQGGTDRGSAKFKIVGNIGIQAAAGGSGTSSNPYYWFDFNIGSNRKAIVDFSSAGQIAPTIANGTYNNIFHSNNDIDIIGANVIANNKNTGTIVRVIGTTYGVVYFEKCRFYIEGYQDCIIAYRGTFTNCRGSVTNAIGNSYCFIPSPSGMVKLNGGEYYAYTGSSTSVSAVVGQSGSTAVSILYGVSIPIVAKEGYYQTHCIYQMTGGGFVNCTDLMTTLSMQVVSGSSNIRGTIAYNKPNVM